MDCEHVKAFLIRFVNDSDEADKMSEKDRRDALDVDAHFKICGSCLDEFNKLAEMTEVGR